MSETTIADPLSGEEIVEAHLAGIRQKFESDCHLNPVLAYDGFESEMHGRMKLWDNGREVEIEFDLFIAQRPPNTVREAANLPIPTLVEGSDGKKEVKAMKYASAKATTKEEPGKPGQPPNQPGQQPGHPGQQPQHPGQQPGQPKPGEPRPEHEKR